MVGKILEPKLLEFWREFDECQIRLLRKYRLEPKQHIWVLEQSLHAAKLARANDENS
jgi:hypothetical protein